MGLVATWVSLDGLGEAGGIQTDVPEGGFAALQVLVRHAWWAGEDEGEVRQVALAEVYARVNAGEVVIVRVQDDERRHEGCENKEQTSSVNNHLISF